MSSDRPPFPAVLPVLARRASFPGPDWSADSDLGPGDRGVRAAGQREMVLLRSWIGQAGAVGCAAWVPVGPATVRISSKDGCETGDDDLRSA